VGRMRQTFWHSSAHILGEALEATYGVKLTIGPAIDEGFYYDCYMGENRTLADGDRGDINKAIERVGCPPPPGGSFACATVPLRDVRCIWWDGQCIWRMYSASGGCSVHLVDVQCRTTRACSCCVACHVRAGSSGVGSARREM
jgi:hypothetical protein